MCLCVFVRVSFNVFVCHVCDLLSDDVWHVFVVLNCLCLCVFVNVFVCCIRCLLRGAGCVVFGCVVL